MTGGQTDNFSTNKCGHQLKSRKADWTLRPNNKKVHISANGRVGLRIHRLFDQKLAAFTLAEVLIVLGIIGIVAQMTIPTLMNNVNEGVYKASYKTAYSTASQAWSMALTEDKFEENVTGEDGPAKVNNFAAFKSYFNVTKDCNSGNNSECWATGEMYWGFPASTASAFIDASGRVWSLAANSVGSGDTLLIDTNGSKKPNKFGQDRFSLEPTTADKTGAGMPTIIIPVKDCLSTTNCEAGNYKYICPSVASHSCYYTTWTTN